MGDLLTTGSILAAFFAGGVALFGPLLHRVPCAVLSGGRRQEPSPAPAALTFVFAAGLALVLVPITLGMSHLDLGIGQSPMLQGEPRVRGSVLTGLWQHPHAHRWSSHRRLSTRWVLC